jgi:peptide/nickel transport system permease protein
MAGTETLVGKKAVAEKSEREMTAEERFYAASQWELMWRKFRKHKLALASLAILAFLYIVAFTFEFWAPYGPYTDQGLVNMQPTRIHLFTEDGRFIGPFVYGIEQELDIETFRRVPVVDKDQIHRMQFFTRGEPYRFWGVYEANLHFVGVEGDGKLLLMGTDDLGRDLFTRVLAGSRISLTIGVVGVFVSLVLGALMGGIAGYYGAGIDLIISRIIEFIGSIPNLPLWMLMASIIPLHWPIVRVYFMTTIIISLLTWVGLARIVRSQILQLRTLDFAKAARLAGASDLRIIVDHLIPGMLSYLIVAVTIAIPQTILAETALSFLGLGLRPPAVSWGVLLQASRNVQNIVHRPWMLYPAIVVILTIFVFNFVGDGLRDAADPYK